jgi:hypothetical protein
VVIGTTEQLAEELDSVLNRAGSKTSGAKAHIHFWVCYGATEVAPLRGLTRFTYGAIEELAEEVDSVRIGRGARPQGLKPTFIFGSVMARLKSCPYAV